MKETINSGAQKYVGAVLNAVKNTESTTDEQKSLALKFFAKEKLIQNLGKVVSFYISSVQTDQNIRSEINIDSDEFKKLLDSIKKYGIIQTPVVELRDNSDTQWGYDLICVAGHRRLLAAEILGIERVNCAIYQFKDSSERTGIALAENLNREGLYSLDIAEGYLSLKNFGWTEEQISDHFERNVRTIQRYLNIALLPEDIKTLIRDNRSKFPPTLVMGNYAIRSFKTEASVQKLREEILYIINPSNENEPKLSKSKILEKKLESYFKENENKLTEENKNMITDVLKYLGYLKVQKTS